MASLLQRMGMQSGAGPVRNPSNKERRPSPYSRSPKGNIDEPWSHDLYDDQGAPSLSDRLSPPGAPVNPHKPEPLPRAAKIAFAAINPDSQTKSDAGPLTIKGASTPAHANVVEVTGLLPGTTPEDVVAIFKRCGAIVSAKFHHHPSIPPDSPVIRITYKLPQAARDAVAKFDKQPADGRVLSVSLVGESSTSLAGRLGISGGAGATGIGDGLDIVRSEGSVDVLMQDDVETSSKMRSDSLLQSDPRAHVLVAPPGTSPSDYTQPPAQRGGRKRGGRW